MNYFRIVSVLRILVHSRFYPNIGGIETVASLLAHEWRRAGEEVILASDVSCSAEQKRAFPFPVYYQPGPCKWLALMRWCDIYLQFNVSLKAAWPLLLVRRPLVVSHQSFYWVSQNGRHGWRNRFKIHLAAKSCNIFASSAIAKELGVGGEVIPNPFDDTQFCQKEVVPRDRDLAFVGRLVSDKGVDCLLRALALLKKRRLSPGLSIIGDGPERSRLERLCAELDLCDQVRFLGAMSQSEISALLWRHQILVVPTLVAEGFGVVALEGLASGCVVIGSDYGGLPEAIGPGGMTFPNGDMESLAEKLELALTGRDVTPKPAGFAESHLANHRPALVAGRYLEVMRQTLSWTST